jgi:hypothetical protein
MWFERFLLCLLFGITLAVSIHNSAQANDRHVVVNGTMMNATQLVALDVANCGAPVPDGSYWLNINTGAWGYQGGPQEGIIGDQCRAAANDSGRQPENQTGTWEDRMTGEGSPNWGNTPIIVNPVYQ